MPEDRVTGRRASDRDIPPAIEAWVEGRLTDERHNIRGEFTIAMQAIEKTLLDIRREQTEARLTSTQEHADVRADIAELRHCIEPIPTLVAKVDVLEEHDTVDSTRKADRDKFISALRWAAMAVITAIGAATGLILAFNH